MDKIIENAKRIYGYTVEALRSFGEYMSRACADTPVLAGLVTVLGITAAALDVIRLVF